MDQQSSQSTTDQPSAQTQTAGQTQPQTSGSPVTQNTDNYFNNLFTGRLNRRNYFIGALILVTINSIIQILFYRFDVQPYSVQLLSHSQTTPSSTSLFANLLSIPIAILVLCISSSLSIRRLHDLNKTGWLTYFVYSYRWRFLWAVSSSRRRYRRSK